MPGAAWPCAPHFGALCPSNGVDVLSATDHSLARRSGLRVFVYRNVPKSFHSGLFTKGLPAEVKRGKMCDFASGPCTPQDPPPSSPGYSMELNEWLHSMKHCADVPLLAKLIALGSIEGVHTDNPAEAHLFVVPFLGGFAERVSPQMSYALDRQRRQGDGIVDRLLGHLPHYSSETAARHLFLLTNSCGGCLRAPCFRCASWQVVNQSRFGAGIEFAATLGPSWPLDAIPKGQSPPSGRKWLRQVIIPPNIMEAELHPPKYVPLCSVPGETGPSVAPNRPCRANSAAKELLAFYQGAHSFNGARDLILKELREAVFSSSGGSGGNATCDCGRTPACCVNATSRVAFFHTRSHWHPVTPLGFAATIQWMQRSKFCVCPPGDVPYNKRYFTAILAGCVPVLFSFRSQVAHERNWWKPKKGPGQRDIDPFHGQINHTALGVEFRIDNEKEDFRGFVDKLRDVPDEVVEAKQREIERVRHLLLYDMSGSREDAFTCMLRQTIRMLAALPSRRDGAQNEPAPLKRPDRRQHGRLSVHGKI